MLIAIRDQYGYIACLYLKRNLITINQSNQQFWDVFLIEKNGCKHTILSYVNKK